MKPVKYIGEQFYIDHRITIDGVAQPLTGYTDIKAILIGNNGEVRYSYPAADGYNTIARPDDYTLRYYVTSDHTKQLGVGNVSIEVMATRVMNGAPDGILKPIFSGDIFVIKPSKIGQNG
jgi:hypothetical protein